MKREGSRFFLEGLRSRLVHLLISSLLGFSGISVGCSRYKSGPPYPPQEALRSFKIEKGFRIELFAAEPLVTSPVAMEFDEYGRIYVVEMPGYPLDTSGSGRVKLLEDTDGDGRPDRSTVFVDKLVLPTGVMRWKKGLLVTDPPNVWYVEDTKGNRRADVRQAVLTGFAFTNPQHTVNGPIYGLDNWIYLAHEPPAHAVVFKDQFGDRGKPIRYVDRSDVPPLEISGRNIRFRPDTYQLEVLSGSSQFGHAFDEWGHHFTLNNSNHLRQEVIAARYLKRNPQLLLSTAMQDLSDHGNACEVFPITHNPQHQMLTDVGRLTSACSLTLYLGGLFPSEFRGVSFVAEPAHNIVHRDVWQESGATYVAKRAQPGVEFLASTDSWFRPVNFYIGPDGALYVLDFYRQVIEHPEWMAKEVYHSHAIHQGVDKGRIYRIVPDSPATIPLPKNIGLGDASDEELVSQLANPNIWWRRTAQRLLVDRKSASAVDPLVHLFKTSPSAQARVHALWTLDGIGKLEPDLLELALTDSEPGVRENAIQLAEAWLSSAPRLVEKLLGLARDQNPKVRFQLLCTLGFLNTDKARAVREKLLFENIEDVWMQLAAISASSDEALHLFEAAVSRLAKNKTPGRTVFFGHVTTTIAARNHADELRRVLLTVASTTAGGSEWWRAACLEGLARGIQPRSPAAGKTAAPPKLEPPSLLKLLDSSAPSVRRASLRLFEALGLPADPSMIPVLKRAASTAANEKTGPVERADAVRLLSLANPVSHAELFKALADPRQPEQVQAAAVRALGRIPGEEVAAYLLKNWRTMTPAVRTEAADAFFREPNRVRRLVNAMKNGEVQPWMLAAHHRHRLIMNEDATIREQARPLLAGKAGERERVVKRYERALEMNGDAQRGEQVFKSTCVKCHQLNGAGGKLGPDLATVRHRTPEALLIDILIPSKSIAGNYETYIIETIDGATTEGLIGADTPTAITLRHVDGTEDVIQRQNIKHLYVSNISAMPEDLDKQIDVQQMADLLKFLKTGR